MMRLGSFAARLSKANEASSDSACRALTFADFSLPSAMRAGFSSFDAFAICGEDLVDELDGGPAGLLRRLEQVRVFSEQH